MIPTEILSILLGGGGVAMLAAAVQAFRSLREGSKADEKDAFADMEYKRAGEKRRADRAEVERDYWHRRASDLEHVIRVQLGPAEVPELEPWPEETPLPVQES